MGACNIRVRARGMNINEAFKNAQEEAQAEYGHQEGYSGAINCCSLVKTISKGDYTEEEILENTQKRDVWGYESINPIGNDMKTKSVVENFPQKGTRKWETVYNVVDWNGSIIISERSQTEAIKKARTYVEKNQDRIVEVVIAKKLIEGKVICAQIRYKKSSKERIGEYIFIGWAPE